jgi:ketosteroid isomerase-like protein
MRGKHVMEISNELQQFLHQMQRAIDHFVAGDPGPYQVCWSTTDDVTIMGAWGAYEQGWELVGPRLEWAAARFRGGHIDFEPLALAMSGDLAYTIWIERGQVRVGERDELSPMVLRVTHLFRREEGNWKLIHRHADAISEKIEATAILQR